MSATDLEPGPLHAHSLLMAFAARRGEDALRLALHAALPQVLRVELVHLMRLNFVPEALHDGAIEADVLFAPFCEDLGNGYYRFGRNVRLQLLQSLDPAYAGAATLRSVQVASFLLSYLDRESRSVGVSHDRVHTDWLETERWSALGFIEPALAAAQLAAALKRATATGDVAARVRVAGLASTLATPLARYGSLLAYAAGMEALEIGRLDEAADLLRGLADAELEVEGIRLRSPRSLLSERWPGDLEADASARQEAAMPGGESASARPVRDLIFISHSRKDQSWFDEIHPQLEAIAGRHGLVVWSETDIATGAQWQREVASAIDRARVAFVIVSPDYLASDLRMQDELQRLVAYAQAGELRLFWICTSECHWQNTPLAPIQAAHDPHEPLNRLTAYERRSILERIGGEIGAYLGSPLGGYEGEFGAQLEAEGQSGARIHLSYRRDDAQGYANRIYDELRERLGDSGVFMEFPLGPGEDWRDVIDGEVRASAAIIVVIGPRWLDARGDDGRRRLDDSGDFVRFEVAAALRQGVPVLPVLVEHAHMPREEDLPEDLADLTHRQAVDLRDHRWAEDFEHLFNEVERIRRLPKSMIAQDEQPRGSLRIFVSSTLTDLAMHRARIHQALTQAGHVVVIDEDYSSADQAPLRRSMTFISESDVFVCIVGWRYGHVLPDRSANPDALSIVELEYREARRLGKPVLAFLAHDEATWPSAMVDAVTGEGQRGERIRHFREELSAEHAVAHFRSPDELAQKVVQAISNRHQAPASSAETAPPHALFYISYLRSTDLPRAEALFQALLKLGVAEGEVWFDRAAIDAGQDYRNRLLEGIRNCRYFLPLLSTATNQREESFIFREWHEANERQKKLDREFIVPVIVDDDYQPNHYTAEPVRAWSRLHFGHAPEGAPDGRLLVKLKALVRDARRSKD